MGPLPRTTEAAGVSALARHRDPSPIEAADFFTGAARLRAAFARLIGTPDPERVAIVPSASYGIATLARNLELGSGRNVVLLAEQFPSNVYAWRRKAEDAEAELRFVAPPAAVEGRAAGWSARVLEAIDDATAVVAMPQVHWTDGTPFDLVAIGARAREIGAAFIVDGSQSIGALPFDLAGIAPDAVVCAGYKWLLGPYGLSLAWYGPRFDGGVPIEENWITRAGSEEFAGLVCYVDDYGPGAVRYDMGERASFVYVSMLTASIELVLGWGVETIQEHGRRLLTDPLRRAAEIGYRIGPPGGRVGHIVGIRTPPGLSPERLRGALADRSVFVSVRGDAVRVSPHVYNDTSDAEALVEALAAVAPVAGG